MSEQHDHGPRLSEDTFSPAADACPFTVEDLPCGCQDVRYACGYVDREHDHVECGVSEQEGFSRDWEPPEDRAGEYVLEDGSVDLVRLYAVPRPGPFADLIAAGYGDMTVAELRLALRLAEDGDPLAGRPPDIPAVLTDEQDVPAEEPGG
jgi:hypothetical protein